MLKKLAVKSAKAVLRVARVEPAYAKALIKAPPAVHGGPRVRRFPWPRRRHFSSAERTAALGVLDRELIDGGAIVYGGPEEAAYTEAFTRFMGGGYAKAVNSGTNALYLALRALDLPAGSEIVTPPITDPGGTMPVPLLNCIPVPADSAPGRLDVSVEQIQEVVTERTSAIVIAHIAGQPVDMDPIIAFAAERKIPIVEDVAQAHGALYKGRLAGTLTGISAFSTMFGKHHATGAQGGVVYSRCPHLFARVKQVADRGKSPNALGRPGNLIASLNFNQDELSMAMGRVQLAKLPRALLRRRAFARALEEAVTPIPGISMLGDKQESHGAYWFALLVIDPELFGARAREVVAALAAEGIEGVHDGYPFFPTDLPWQVDAVAFGDSKIPWALAQRDEGARRFDLPNAHAANKSMVRIEIHEELGPQEAADIATALKKYADYVGRAAA